MGELVRQTIDDVFEADRATFQELGLSDPPRVNEIVAAVRAWWDESSHDRKRILPNTLRSYVVTETSRSTGDEWIVYPNTMTLVQAEGRISPRKV